MGPDQKGGWLPGWAEVSVRPVPRLGLTELEAMTGTDAMVLGILAGQGMAPEGITPSLVLRLLEEQGIDNSLY